MLTGVADALYVFQPSGTYTGTYQSYVNGFGQNGGNPRIWPPCRASSCGPPPPRPP